MPTMRIGINMHRPAFGSDGAFINLMKESVSGDPSFTGAPWTPVILPSRAHDTRTLAVDRYGRVTSLLANQGAFTVVQILSGGPHVLTYAGSGTILIGPQATNMVSTPGRITFDLPAPPALQGYQLQILITAIDASNPIHNIRLVPAQYDGDLNRVYHPNFLNAVAPFGVIRMHEWARMDEVSATNWADRTPPSQLTQAGQPLGGVSFEHQILLGNTLAKDIWINIPHRATDDFVTRLAELLRDTFDPAQRIYLEYSNECWNGAYPQHAYCQQQGVALNLDPNPAIAALRFQALRSGQVYQIFQNVFGAERAARVVFVLSSLVGATGANNTLLTSPIAIQPDAFAVACYFGYPQMTSALADQLIANGLDWLMNDLITNAVPATLNQLRASMAIATQHSLPMVCYEGGQSLLGSPNLTQAQNAGLNTLFDAANEDPRMGTCYTNLFDGARSIGLSLINHFALFYRPGQFGRWGLLHVRDQDPATSPKYQAVTRWIAANP